MLNKYETTPDRRATGLRSEQLGRLLTELEERGGDAPSGRFRAITALVTDAVLTGDESALLRAQDGLHRVRACQLTGAEDSQSPAEQRGRTLALLDVVGWTLRRLIPRSLLLSLEGGSDGRRFLEALDEMNGLTAEQLAQQLHASIDAVRATGGQLAQAGVVIERWIEDIVAWELTSRGREALRTRKSLSLERGVQRMAREILEPPWSGTEGQPGRRRGVTSEILAVLVANHRPLTLKQLGEETRYSEGYIQLGLLVLTDNQYVRIVPGDIDRYEVNDNCCVIGINIEPSCLLGTVADLRGEPLRVEERQLHRHDPTTVVREIASLVRHLRASEGLPEYIVGLGVDIGGHVDTLAGNVVFSPNLQWEHRFPLQDRLHFATGLPTVVENDLTALAIYQQLFGRLGSERTNFAVILVSHGIGAGLVVDGDIIHGATGMAGEIGHVLYKPGGRSCRCRNRGCVEAYAGVDAIRNGSVPKGVTPPETLAEVAELVARHDRLAERAVADAGEAVGRAILMVENLVNPREILVAVPPELSMGTAASPAARLFAKSLHEGTRAHAFSSSAADSRLRIEHVADLHRRAAQGAAAAVVRWFLKQPLRWRLMHTNPGDTGSGETTGTPGSRGQENPRLHPMPTPESSPLIEPVGENLVKALNEAYRAGLS